MSKRRVDIEVLQHFDKVELMLKFCIREGSFLGYSVFGGAWDCGHEPEFLEHLQRSSVCDTRRYDLFKKVKIFRFCSRTWFFAPNLCSLPRLVKGATQLCTSQSEYYKLHLTMVQYFCLVDHNDWSRWFAIPSPPCIWSSSFSLIGGVAKRKTAKRRHLNLLSRVTY
jgi:hypothetical protein